MKLGPYATATLASGEQFTIPTLTRPTAVDAVSVYWATKTGEIRSAALAGSMPVTLVSGQLDIQSIVVDASYLYWSVLGPGDSDGALRKVPLSGGAPMDVVTGQSKSSDFAIDATHIYWANYGSAAGGVWKAELAGGSAPVRLYDMPTYGIALDTSSVYFFGTGLVLMRVPKAGGTVVPLSNPSNPGLLGAGIVADSSGVYWIDQARELRAVMSGSTTVTPLFTSTGVGGIAVDGTSVYFTHNGAVLKMPKAGGTAVPLAVGQQSPMHPLVDASSIYWVNYSPMPLGTFMVTPKTP